MRFFSKIFFISIFSIFIIVVSSFPLAGFVTFSLDISYGVGGYNLEVYNVSRREALKIYIMAHQTVNGGFKAIHWMDRADGFGTVFAVKALKLLGYLDDQVVDDVYSYIMRLYDERGFFYPALADNDVGMMDVWAAIESLYTIGKLDDLSDDVKQSIIDWILYMQDEETGLFFEDYYPSSGERVNLYSGTVFSAVRCLQLLGALDLVDREKIIRSIFEYFYYDDGTFGDNVFHTGLTNLYVVWALKILGGLNDSVAYRNAETLIDLIDPSTGIEYDGNLDGTGTIIITLDLLGYLHLLPVNVTVETLLSMQDHTYGGFMIILGSTDPEDKHAGMRAIYGAVKSLYLLNASHRLDEPFYIEEIPDFSQITIGDEKSGENHEESESSPFPNSDFDALFGAVLALVVIFGITFLVVGPIIYVINKRLDGSKGRGRRRRFFRDYRLFFQIIFFLVKLVLWAV